MRHTLSGLARVALLRGQVRVDTVQQQLKTLGRIAQTAERKTTAGQRTAGQRAAQRLRAQRGLGASLQLLEELLQVGEC